MVGEEFTPVICINNSQLRHTNWTLDRIQTPYNQEDIREGIYQLHVWGRDLPVCGIIDTSSSNIVICRYVKDELWLTVLLGDGGNV